MSNEITSEKIRAMALMVEDRTLKSDDLLNECAAMLRTLAGEREQFVNELQRVTNQLDDARIQLQQRDAHITRIKVAEREQSSAVVTDKVVNIAFAAALTVAGESKPWLSREIIRAALEAVAPLLQSPAVDHAAMVAKLRELINLLQIVESSDEPLTEHDLGYDQASAEIAGQLLEILSTEPTTNQNDIGSRLVDSEPGQVDVEAVRRVIGSLNRSGFVREETLAKELAAAIGDMK